ncbi:carbohydrate sulfotransferase 15-like [Diadema setosum]|uniref:carbohydrate sulfotransferase 15-like n=1 Tax=Diadema setosum TaxID=31175 RepID=UPI003B3BE009
MPKRVKPATCVGVGVVAFCLVLIPSLRKVYRKDLSLGSYASLSSQLVQRFTHDPSTKTRLVYGDGSPSTFWDNQNWKTWFRNRYQGPQYVTADVMRAIQPDAKLLVILREPVSRLYSGYLYFEDSSIKSPEHFHQEVTMAISKFNSCREKLSYRACAYSPDQVHHGYFAVSHRILIGLYAVFTRDWLRAFPIEQLKIVRMEDWQVNCTGILTDIFSFLTLGNLSPEQTAQICEATPQNSNKAKLGEVGDMLPQTVTLLKDFYQQSNEELSQLLCSDTFLWKDTYLAQERLQNERDG